MKVPALRHTPIALILVIGVAFAANSAGDQLDANTARSLIQTILGGELRKNQVVIKSIKSESGDTPIVEAQVETAYRFLRDGKGWKIAEIRLGDRHWESFELIDTAIRTEKTKRTQALLQKIGDSLESFRSSQGSQGGYVIASDFDKMLDQLAPRFLNPVVRLDFWGSPLTYEGGPQSYRLASAGPDAQPGTSDDLVLEKRVGG
jgi:hypothetical protein